MAVFSRYAKVVEPDGSDMTVRRALELINNSVQSYMVERGVSMDLFFLNVS
jgi:putative DNA methylase